MEHLSRSDQLFLDAAEGWLGLGNHIEAFQELERISAPAQDHPDVLRVRYGVFAASRKWEPAVEVAEALSRAFPEEAFGPIHLAYALHELRRTQAAWNVLLPQAPRFPKEHIIPYNLACYACQLGNLEEGRRWLGQAIEVAGLPLIRKMALGDRDLEPLWPEIRMMN